MARDRNRLGCAAESVARNEPLMATASRVRRWLLVEQSGPWGREALIESRLDTATAQTLRSHARRDRVRVVLIRRPGWDTSSSRRRVSLVRSDRAHAWIRRLDVDEPHDLLSLDLSLLDSDEPPAIGEAGPPSVHLVCTNGKHDPCCADMGRPVVRALRDGDTPEVWESSHVGGDRFAANLVFLPSGVYYGRVPPDDAARLVDEVGRGLLDLDLYRGRSCYPPMTQAAEIFVRRELDERGLDALRPVSSKQEDKDTATVVFERGDEAIEVRVGREPGPAEHLTCGDHGTSHPWQYHLRNLEVLPS